MRIYWIPVLLAVGLGACATKGERQPAPPEPGEVPDSVTFGEGPDAARLTFDPGDARPAPRADEAPRIYRNVRDAFPSAGEWWLLGYRPVGRATLDIPKTGPGLDNPEREIAEYFRKRGADVVVVLRDADARAPSGGASKSQTELRRIVAEGYVQDPDSIEVSARKLLQTATEAATSGDWPKVGSLLNPDRVRDLGVVDDIRPSSIVPLAIRADYQPLCISFAKMGFRTLSSRQLSILFQSSLRDLPDEIGSKLKKAGSVPIVEAALAAKSKRCGAVFRRAAFTLPPSG